MQELWEQEMPLKYKGGHGLWAEYVDTDTNKSSIQYHEPKVIETYCKPQDHFFMNESGHSREVYCIKCGMIATYVLGLQKLINGKIVNIEPQG